jgi:Domain of unknown function (DUF1905)/Bacteriocin-protection, YdeI or OmpD-Associated
MRPAVSGGWLRHFVDVSRCEQDLGELAAGKLRFVAELRPQRRGWLGLELPASSARFLRSRGQVPVEATVEGTTFRTIAFPRGDGGHFMLVRAQIRHRLGLTEGDEVDVTIKPAPRRPPAPMPEELTTALASSGEAKAAWDDLTPAARQIASRWIGSAKSVEVREWRVSDVIRRAMRYQQGAGPFYPTKEDQKLLARPRRHGDARR